MNIRTYDEETHNYALELLKADGVIVAPSVTNYGVFCSATSASGIARIFKMKERTKFGPLTLGIGDPNEARTYADIPAEFTDEIISELLLGMTTTIFFKNSEVLFPEQMTMGAPTVGLFCHGMSPMYEIGRDFGPIALTSSNISGTGGHQVTREQAINDLGQHVDLVIDDGPIGWDDAAGTFQSNTVVDFTFNPPHLVRPGRFPIERLKILFPTLVTDLNAYKEVMALRMGDIKL
ncbi:L-threonylcarbamoyladenylate synthase [Vibrio spartinae]|uniref:L-threonylcarbamoyladenylate synthase n=1 Tax=Vibrio spartinae TaxID=1918945 RepID=A0ABX6R2E2_9VIBR|nr:Sua5/YciO/YrdC/YwlC family protein [Vibrio spartinae]QMV15688.1 Sua5/YciO/YrdC/YwlC family protein [Vibrio spartinae]